MIITGIIIFILNFVIIGAVLLADFTIFGRLVSASDASPRTPARETHGVAKTTETTRAQDNSSLQTVA